MIKRLLPLIFLTLFTACALSPEDAANLGFEQGRNGQAYSSIGGDNSALHRQAWVRGNQQYCGALNYGDLARRLGQLPTNICSYTSGQRRAYCNAVDYAAFGRANKALPQECGPSAAQNAAYSAAREGAVCTRATGRDDARRAANNLFERGDCSDGGTRGQCQRNDFERAAKDFCEAVPAYVSGINTAFIQAQADALGTASREVAALSAIAAPTPAQSARQTQLVDYIDWVGDCELDGLDVDC